MEKEEKIESDPIKKENTNEETEKKQNSQLFWAMIIMISIIVIVLTVPYIINNYINKFDYGGIEFTKTKFGKLDVYVGEIPLFSKNPDEITGGAVSKYLLYLRNDPRKLQDIKVLTDINNITFVKKKKVYVSYNSTALPCQYNVVSAAELGKFLINFGGLDVEGAFTEKEAAEKNDIPYVTCETHSNNTVILVVNGEENKIEKIKKNCYMIQYKDCDILQVTERFILAIIEGYINYTYSEITAPF